MPGAFELLGVEVEVVGDVGCAEVEHVAAAREQAVGVDQGDAPADFEIPLADLLEQIRPLGWIEFPALLFAQLIEQRIAHERVDG